MPTLAEIGALVEQIRDARPEALDPVAAGWAGAATAAAAIGARAAAVDRDTAVAFTNDRAEVYDAAAASARTRTALGDGGEHYATIGRAVAVVRDELASTKSAVLASWDQLRAELTAVGDALDGLARAAPSMTPSEVDARAAALQARSDQALAGAGATITRLLDGYTGVLVSRRGVLADLGFAGPPAPVGAPPLPAERDPAAVSAWYRSLTGAQQAALLENDPALLGNLDGVPATVRDLANRTRLPGEITRIDAEIAATQAALDVAHQQLGPLLPGMEARSTTSEERELRTRLARLQDQRAALAAIADTVTAPDRQLLLLDVADHAAPRAAVAVGDVDTAQHVAVFTPGFTTTVAGGLRGYTDDMAAVQQTALKLQFRVPGHENQSVAAVTWIGYDAPQWDTVAEPGRSVLVPIDARHAGTDLARFYDGINTSRVTDPHLTAVGHSYGSTTTGYALQHTTTPIDDAIVFGSPGLGTDDVTDLHVPAGHVAAMRAFLDPVASFGVFGDKVTTMPGVTVLSSTDHTAPDGTSLDGVTGHSAYLEPGSTSQYNIAATVAGLPDQRILGSWR